MIRLRRYDYGHGTSVILRASTAARSLVLLCLRRASRVGRRRVSVRGRVMGASERGAHGHGHGHLHLGRLRHRRARRLLRRLDAPLRRPKHAVAVSVTATATDALPPPLHTPLRVFVRRRVQYEGSATGCASDCGVCAPPQLGA